MSKDAKYPLEPSIEKLLDIPFKEFMPGQVIQSSQFNDDMLDIEDKVNEIITKHNGVDIRLSEHQRNLLNPHCVTATQINAYEVEEVDELIADVKNGNLNDEAITNRVLADACVDNRVLVDGVVTLSKLDTNVGNQIDISNNMSIKERYTKLETDAIIQEKVGDGTYSKEQIDAKFEEYQAGTIVDGTLDVTKFKNDVGRKLDITNNPSISNRYTKSEVNTLIAKNGLPKDWGNLSDEVDDEIVTQNGLGSLPISNVMVCGEFKATETDVLNIKVQDVEFAKGEFNTLEDRLDNVDTQLVQNTLAIDTLNTKIQDIEFAKGEFDALEERLNNVDTQLEENTSTIDVLNTKVQDVEFVKGELNTLEERFDNVDTQLAHIEVEVEELFQSVSNGKTLIASAITDKGIATTSNATFEVMANNIRSISSSVSSSIGGFIDDSESNNIFMYGLDENTYTLKFEDNNGVLESFDNIGHMNARRLSNNKVIYENKDLIKYNIAPYSASKIGVFDSNDLKVAEIPLESFKPSYGERLYRFGLLSDVHNNGGANSGSENASSESTEDLQKALKFFNEKQSVWATCICGDLTDTGAEDQLQIYKANVDTNSPNTPVYTCAGNHDCRSNVSDEIWEKYSGNKRCFEITKNKDHFLFFGMSKESMGASGTPYLETDIDWLEEKLEEYRNERCFVFMHLFFPDRSGNLKRLYSPNNWLGGSQLTRIQGLCDHYVNTIWFSGHSHWKWSSQMYEEDANIWKSETSGWCVHVPSCAVPKYIANANSTSVLYDPKASEGAIVDVYENYIDIRAIDLKNEKYIPIGQYRLDTNLVYVPSNKTIDDVTDEIYWFDAYISSSTGQLSTAESGYSTSTYIIYDSNKTYTLYFDSKVQATRVFYYDINKTFINCTQQLTSGEYEITPPANTAYFKVRTRRGSGVTVDDVQNHIYMTTVDTPEDVIEFNGDYDELHWFTHYISSSTGEIGVDPQGYNYATTAFLRYDSNNIYKFSQINSLLMPYRVFYYDSNKKFISCDSQVSTATYTISSAPEGTKYFRLRCKLGGDFDTYTGYVKYTITKKPTYNVTNLVSTSQNVDNSNVYNNVGYKDNTYISTSTLADAEHAGYVFTGCIPFTITTASTPIIYVKGVEIDITDSYVRFAVYDSNKQNTTIIRMATFETYFVIDTLGDKYYKLSPAYAASTGNTRLSNLFTGDCYIRIGGKGIGDDLIVTFDTPIE